MAILTSHRIFLAMHSFNDFTSTSTAPLRDYQAASTPVGLIELGWTFQAEPTTDCRWKVSASKKGTHLSAVAGQLGHAFQEVESKARDCEMALAS
jgi:hypothetical protein